MENTAIRCVSPAVAVLYHSRWRIELFFRWIKQNLRIRRFYGTSENAVRTQLWIAICVYVLIAILKKEFKLPQSLHRILQVGDRDDLRANASASTTYETDSWK